MEHIVGLLLTGAGVGLLSSFLGFGGGTLMVPVLPTLAGLSTKSAIATSLFVITLNSLRNTISFHKKGLVDWSLIKNVVPAALIFALISSYSTSIVNTQILNWILVIIFSALAAMTALGSDYTPLFIRTKNRRNYLLSSLGVGTLSGLSGIGGGTFVVPLMIAGRWVLPTMVSPTGNAINLFTALVGATMLQIQSDLIQFQSAFIILAASVITSQWARKQQALISENTRRKLIILFLITVILKLIWQAVHYTN